MLNLIKLTNLFCLIKKIVKIIIILILSMIGLGGLLTVILHIPVIQSDMTTKIISRLEKEMNTQISFSKVRFGLLRPVYFENFLINDQQGDTLIFAKRISATPDIHFTALRNKSVVLRSVNAKGAFVRFIAPPGQDTNFKFLFHSHADSIHSGFYFAIRKATLSDSRFQLKITPPKKKYGMHFTYMNLRHINGKVRNLEIFDRVTKLSARNLRFTDISGWRVNDFSVDMKASPNYLWFDNIEILTPYSKILANYYHMDYHNRYDYKDFNDKIHLSALFRPSLLGYHDLNYIAQDSLFMRNDIHFSAKAKGVLANLSIKQLIFKINKRTYLSGDLSMIGLPDIKTTYIYFNVRKLVSHVEDIQNIYRPGTKQKLNLPENLKELGNISYTGNFTGFLTDFVSYGKLTTDIGYFEDDISFSTDSTKHILFNGFLGSVGFDLGKFSGQEKILGEITMHASMHGKISPVGGKFSSKLTGIIDSIEFNRYIYHNISLDGHFTEKAYDGSIRIDDPNLKLDFLGMFDFTNSMPEFDFSLNIPRAALFPLHLSPRDTSLIYSGLVLANFKGNNIRDFNGEIKLLDARLKRKDKNLDIYNVKLLAQNTADKRSLQLKSQYLTASLDGYYNFSDIQASFKNLLARYIPSVLNTPLRVHPDNNNFTFSVNINNIDPFTNFFAPGFSIAQHSKLTGRYAPDIHLLSLQAHTNQLITRTITADSLAIGISTNDNLDLEISSSSLQVANKVEMENFSSDIVARRDSLQTFVLWTEKLDTTHHLNELHLLANISRKEKTSKPHIDLFVDSSNIHINNRPWFVRQGHIGIDTSSLWIHHFGLISMDKSFSVSGKFSHNPSDTLRTVFKNLDLSSLNTNNVRDLQLGGILSGEILLSNVYKQPVFLSEINIKNFSFNQDSLGDAFITSTWDTLGKQLSFKVHSNYGSIHPVIAAGSYSPSKKSMRGDITLDKFKLLAFSTFVSTVFSDLNGNVSGKIHIEGKLTKPKINGALNFQKTSLTVDFLQTRYSFTARVPIENNRFILNNIKIYDKQGNHALSHGFFSVENFKHPAIDLTLETDKMLFIHTSEKDNDYFYGTAFASGAVGIKGPLQNIRLDISAKTAPQTAIFLPLYQGKTINAYHYIHFVSGKTAQTKITSLENKKLKVKGVNLILNIAVTPDARVTLLFDPNAGGTLEGRGHGNLRMEIKKTGDFNLLGEYIVDEGSYQFSLQNIINKKFRLESGGKITWNGKPLDANLDLLATYPVKTSLYPLFYDENYKKRVPVECQILLKGKLNKPRIGFNIDLPTVDEETRSKVKNAISTEEELSKQFLSLLILNSFYPDPAYGQPGDIASAGALGVTATEVLSNQLSSWLSQISRDFDVGFSYHPGDVVSSDQVEVALSTQLLNDRVSIYSNLDFSGQNNANIQPENNIVGDFRVEVKITRNGKLRVKAFTRANNKYLYETAPYTNGIGIFYREEFTSWEELVRHYWDKLFARKEENNPPLPSGGE